jgi:hypothetical protein
MKDFLAYLKKFYDLSKTKLTTYVALWTAGITELLNSWDQAASLFPHWLLQQKAHIISASALLAVWSRIRKEL